MNVEREASFWRRTRPLALCGLLAVALGSVAGCPLLEGLQGPQGPQGQPGASVGVLSGTVTNSATDAAVAGIAVTTDPAIEGVEITTGADGSFLQQLPIGVYTLAIEDENFEAFEESVSILAGETTTVAIELTAVSPVVVTVTIEGDALPGATLTATVSVETLDGSTVEGYAWSQANSVDVTLGGTTTNTATATLPGVSAYKAELLAYLAETPIGEDDIPDYVHPPESEAEGSEGDFVGGLQDRFYVLGLSPFALEEAGHVGLEVEVTTSSGTYTGEGEIHTELPWGISPGIRNVPVGATVLLHGKTQDTHDWAMTTPSASSASLTDDDTQNPYFTADEVGLYTVTVTDTTVDPAEEVTLEIYAGTWVGVIVGQDAEGRPVSEPTCMFCHTDGGLAPDMFTPWAETGHAEIFSVSLNTSTHYSTSCLSCHTVGYDPDLDNGGFDDTGDYEDFLAATTEDGAHFHADADNWDNMLDDTPDTARLANIQCENCHGPQGSAAHLLEDGSRVSLSSDVCAACHGEPLRHGRFQQWQLSAHANYELAIDESQSGSCSRCHTGNGFLAWLEDSDADPDTNATVTWTEDETHPQTCVTCHDPHDVGTTTGEGTDAMMRIYGDTPELTAGFTAYGVGNGAICMTCHNSRRGLRNDDTFDGTDTARAPHGSAQTDVVMGQNAYLVDVGVRGPHSLVEDTCVNCHMTQSPPPEALSYELGGTNHTFFASGDICANCHGEVFNAEGVEAEFEALMDELKTRIQVALLDLIEAQIGLGNKIDLNGDAVITDAATISTIEFGESHGRQAITLTLTDGTVLGPYRMTDVDVLDAGDADLGELYDFAADDLVKAGWNWNLANNDGSHAVHNPSFVFGFLNASINALN